MTRLINPPGVLAQDYYNHAVVKAGTPVFVTGQVAWDLQGKIVGIGDIAAQAAQVWRNIDAVVAEIGADRTDIVKIITYATSPSFIDEIKRARAAFFAGGIFPASTFIVVAGLAEPELLLEIEVTLMLPSNQ